MNAVKSVSEWNQAAKLLAHVFQEAGGIFTCSREFDLHNGRA